jgi:hypothetical protein
MGSERSVSASASASASASVSVSKEGQVLVGRVGNRMS